MGHLDDLRRANFKKLVDRYGAASLARRLELSGPSYIGQILTGRRPLSEKTARKFEEKLGLTPRYLDSQNDVVPFEGTSPTLMAEAVRAVGEILEHEKIRPQPAKFAELVAMVYEQSVKVGHVDLEHARRLIKLLK